MLSALLLLGTILSGQSTPGNPSQRAPSLEELEEDPVHQQERLCVLSRIPSQRTEPRFTGERISLSLADADLVEVLRAFARLSGANLVVAPGVQGKVTLELSDVPWDQALSVILKSQGLGARLEGRVWSVGGPP